MADVPRHVALVVPSLTLAGAERVAQTLAREFARTTRVTLVTMEPRLSTRELESLTVLPWAEQVPATCQHVHLPSTGSGLSRLLPLVSRFAALARKERFDAVYSFLTWTNILVSTAKLLGGRYRHVASEHAMAESLRSDGGQLASLARSLPLVYRRPDWIVVVSDAVRHSLRAAGVLPRPGRVVTIPNPVDGAQIRELSDAPIEVALASGVGPILVCVARLHQQKDHDTLLQAMVQLPDSYQLFLVGDGPLRQALSDTVTELGLEDQVTFVGTLANPYPLMRRADLIILASSEEGFGLVAAEAAALGVPFLGSDVGGLLEVCTLLRHRTFPVGDSGALAQTIIELTTQGPNRTDAAAQVDRLFGPAKIAAQYLRLGLSAP